MSRIMAPPALPLPRSSMRLTVEVLPLAAEDAHGPSRLQAMADIKGRKFALPVQLHHTFRQVWSQIEERFKKNYLSAQQAGAFTINRLQDAYDCDLDVDDTVGSIFEGETDPAMRTIKVVPSFADRDFSVPVTSNLRPASAQKRLLEISVERANKRRRLQHPQLRGIREESHTARDQPLPTTESGPDGAANGVQPTCRLSRSLTGASLVLVKAAHTGDAEFGPLVKEESPELGVPPGYNVHAQPEDEPELEDEPGPEPEPEPEPEIVPATKTAILRSPKSTPLHSPRTPPPGTSRRKDVYDVSSSPEFMTKEKRKPTTTTYGRSPKTVLNEVGLINTTRRLPSQNKKQPPTTERPSRTLLEKAHAFQLPRSDEIGSTPQDKEALEQSRRVHDAITTPKQSRHVHNAVTTPTKLTPVETPKPSSLKKPSRNLKSATKAANDIAASSSQQSTATPKGTSTPQGIKPSVQGKIGHLRQRRNSSQALIDRHLHRSSLQSRASTQSAAATSLPTASTEKMAVVSVAPTEKKTATATAAHSQPQAKPPIVARMSVQPSNPSATPQQTPVPSPATPKRSVQKSTSLRSNSIANNVQVFEQPAIKHLSSTSEGVNEHSRQHQPESTPVPASSAPKKRGRPRNNATIEPAAAPESTSVSASSTPKKRGHPRNDTAIEPAAAPKPFAKPSSVKPSRAESVKPNSPKTSAQANSVSREAVVISSGEPESSDCHEDDEVSQDVPVPVTNGSTAQDGLQSDARNALSQLPQESSNGSESLKQSTEVRSSAQDQVTRSSPVKKSHNRTPWNSNSWDFGNIDASNGVSEEPFSNQEANARRASPSQQSSNGKDETISNVGLAREEESQARSVSPAVSTRSSPALVRRPARFLSHSPTPEGSDAEDDDSETSASPSQASTPQVANIEEESESDSESNSSSESDSVASASDTEMPDVPVTAPSPSSTQHLPSSPPQPVAPPPISTPIVPETSQPAPTSSQRYQKAHIALPPLTSTSQIQSSATPSIRHPTHTTKTIATATPKTPIHRPRLTAKTSQFSGLKDQLVQVQTLSRAKGMSGKAFDPRNVDMAKLVQPGGARGPGRVGSAAGVQGKAGPLMVGHLGGSGAAGGLDASSSDEESSEESSDSDGD